MGNMKRLLVILVLMAGVGVSQQQNTIYQALGTTITTQTTFFIKSIGQIGHTILWDQTGCTAAPTVVAILGDYTGVSSNPTSIASASSTTTATELVTTGGGLYPYIRVLITPGTNCSVSAFYVGTIYPTSPAIAGVLPSSTTAISPINIVANAAGAMSVSQLPSAVRSTNSNDTAVTLCTGLCTLTGVFVGVAGTTSTLSLICGSTVFLTVDTTKVGMYNMYVNPCAAGTAFKYTTAGAVAAYLNIYISQYGQ